MFVRENSPVRLLPAVGVATVGRMTGPVLGRHTWPEIADSPITLLVALGSLEQHGPHLPLDTDTRIAAAVAAGARARMADPSVLLAPELNYGASGEHEGFPGTISIGHEALRSVLVEFGRSACRWADRIVFVNGHGGNAATAAAAVSLLRYEGRDVAWFPCAFASSDVAADAHAGHTETSVLLHLSPELVNLERAAAGNVAPIATLLPTMRAGGVAAVSESGVLGDPRGASAAAGDALVEGLTARLADAVTRWAVTDDGRLS